MSEGPIESTVIKYTCTGYIFLETKHWRFERENDEIDSGTDAKCTKVDKHIESYWYSHNNTPKWCPFLTGKL
jgi:hypothetical protein